MEAAVDAASIPIGGQAPLDLGALQRDLGHHGARQRMVRLELRQTKHAPIERTAEAHVGQRVLVLGAIDRAATSVCPAGPEPSCGMRAPSAVTVLPDTRARACWKAALRLEY